LTQLDKGSTSRSTSNLDLWLDNRPCSTPEPCSADPQAKQISIVIAVGGVKGNKANFKNSKDHKKPTANSNRTTNHFFHKLTSSVVRTAPRIAVRKMSS